MIINMNYIFDTLVSPGPIFFNLGPLTIRWYGLLIASSILIGFYLSSFLAESRGIHRKYINDLTPILVLCSLVGARIYYVAFEWRNFSGDYFWSSINILGVSISIPSVFAIWGGGIAIHGALIAGSISVFIFCRLKKIAFWNFIDVLIPSVILGQAIGRWGNFFNNEAFGIPTDLPWKVWIPITLRPINEAGELIFGSSQYFHPTFLYESISNILIFLIILFVFNKGIKGIIKLLPGAITFIYLIAYSLGRFWIEGLRIDSLCVASLPPDCEGGIRIAQLISIVLVCAGSFGLWRLYNGNKLIRSLGQTRNQRKT